MRIRLAALAAAVSFSALAASFTFRDPAAVTVTTTATALTTGTPHFVEVCNTDTSKELRIGFSSAVTASTGRPLSAGSCIQYGRLVGNQTMYGIVASGSLVAVVTKVFEQ